MSFSTLVLLGVVSVAVRGAATIGTQPQAYGMHRPAASPLQWLPVFLATQVLAATSVQPSHLRRLARVFTTKADLRAAVQAYDANPTGAIATYGPIAGWDVSAITDMKYLFIRLRNFNADISSWDTSRVTNMNGMFGEAAAFNQPLSLDTSSVTDMNNMFRGAAAFNQPLSLDTSSVTSMWYMFTVRFCVVP